LLITLIYESLKANNN